MARLLTIAAVMCVLGVCGAPAMATPAKLSDFRGMVDPSFPITVSGVGSGGSFASQFHVAFSNIVNGAGIFAGVPYHCSRGNAWDSLLCVASPSWVDIQRLINDAKAFAQDGQIDDLVNLENDLVYIYHSPGDLSIMHGAGTLIREFYLHFMLPRRIQFVDSIHSSHGVPTYNYGEECYTVFSSIYLKDCDYQGVFEMLNFLYGGGLAKPLPNEPAKGRLVEIDQDSYITGPAELISMANKGYLYLPEQCEANPVTCRLHVAFHGCEMGVHAISDVFIMHAGYLEVADLNNLVVFFPQIVSRFSEPTNPMGCWDWFGYDDGSFSETFALQSGPQMEAVHNMVVDLLGLSA